MKWKIENVYIANTNCQLKNNDEISLIIHCVLLCISYLDVEMKKKKRNLISIYQEITELTNCSKNYE